MLQTFITSISLKISNLYYSLEARIQIANRICKKYIKTDTHQAQIFLAILHAHVAK
jgi:hypothetical protein